MFNFVFATNFVGTYMTEQNSDNSVYELKIDDLQSSFTISLKLNQEDGVTLTDFNAHNLVIYSTNKTFSFYIGQEKIVGQFIMNGDKIDGLEYIRDSKTFTYTKAY